MRCPEDAAWGRYLDGELPSADQEVFRDHLLTCPACGRLVERLLREDGLIASALASAPLPADLEFEVNRRLREIESGGGRWLQFTLPALMLVSTMLSVYFNWLPLAVRLREVLSPLLYGNLMLEFALLAARTAAGLAQAAMAGGPVLPAVTVLAFCVFWLGIKIRKGGHAHV